MDEQPQYAPPLDRLFRMGEVEWGVEWQGTDPDYVAELGLTVEHVPALVEIARRQTDLEDFPDEDAGWAPVHAWRALGQLRASDAVEPLLSLATVLTDTADDYHVYDFPVVFGMMGPAAISALAGFLRNAENPLYARITAADGLCNVGLRHPPARQESLGPLVEQLGRFEENEYELNGFLVSQLTRLKAVEAAELIERAFASNRVAEDISGYWGAVRRELGVEGLGVAPDEPPRPPRRLSPDSTGMIHPPLARRTTRGSATERRRPRRSGSSRRRRRSGTGNENEKVPLRLPRL